MSSLKEKHDQVENFKLNWKRISPKNGQSHTLTNGGKTFHWCQRCGEGRGLWVNHRPEEHRENENEQTQGLLKATVNTSTPQKQTANDLSSPNHINIRDRNFAACGALNIPFPKRHLVFCVIGPKGKTSQDLRRKIGCWFTLIGDDQWSQIRVYGDDRQSVADGLKYLNEYIYDTMKSSRQDWNVDEIFKESFYDFDILKNGASADSNSEKRDNEGYIFTKKRKAWKVVIPRIDKSVLRGAFDYNVE